jgi:hypothetical protein
VPIIDEQSIRLDDDRVEDDESDLGWATVLKRTFEAYVRGERPNMVRRLPLLPTCLCLCLTSLVSSYQYGEYIRWE